jgi:predicted RNase H-like nuclease (RuvC/YqgF family)
MLSRFRERQPRMRPHESHVHGSACQAALREEWDELRAWNGFLASNLEGAVHRIERLDEAARDGERQRAELAARLKEAEYRASNKNMAALEQSIAELSIRLREREQEIERLKLELTSRGITTDSGT